MTIQKKVRKARKPRPLTPRQLQIYEFLRDKIRNRGYGPTVREIADNFGISSPNGVMCHLRALQKKGLIQRTGHLSRAIELAQKFELQRTSLPLIGQVAAGTPVLAVENIERIDFAHLFDDEQEQFCLRVRGDSMIDEHIADGDYVIIRRQQTARDGEIVVALVDHSEATLKRFYREADRFRLEPANSTMRPIYAQHVDILGVLIGVIRTY